VTNAELAILSLVAERPCHGYEIEQLIEARGMRDWTEIGFSSIYYLLKKLKKRLVWGQLEPAARGPARQVYRLTGAGDQAWRAAVPMRSRRRSTAIRRCSWGYRACRRSQPTGPGSFWRTTGCPEARLAHVQQRRASQQPVPHFVDAMFEHSITLLQAEMAWLDRFIQQVEANDAHSGFPEGA
jgi:DNA-binding PadR family transcriptional regulator